MTSLFLKDNYIFYSQDNDIKALKLEETLTNDFEIFNKYNDYNTAVECLIKSIKSLPKFEKLIIDNDYYNHFGLIEQLEENNTLELSIVPEFSIHNNITSNNYIILDVSESSINVYTIKEGNIVKQSKIDTMSILEPLFNNLKEFCLAINIDEFKTVFFDYKKNCYTYNWIKNDKYSIEDLDEVAFNIGQEDFFSNIDLKTFIEILSKTISEFIDESYKKILFQSPFTNLPFINSLNRFENIVYVDEFSRLLEPIEVRELIKNNLTKPIVELHLKNKNKSWVLIDLEKNELVLDDSKHISLTPIVSEIENTSFKIKQNKFVKLYFEINTNFLNNSCLKIKTIDDKIIYKTL